MDTSRQEPATDRELAECRRFSNDLQDQLRHARAEQDRIRQLLQSRLSSSLQEFNHVRHELDTQLNEARQQLQVRDERIGYLESALKAEQEDRASSDEARQREFEASLAECRLSESRLIAEADLRHQAVIRALQHDIEEHQNALRTMEENMKRAQSGLESLARQNERHMTELCAVRADLADSQAELQRIRESFVWKLTGPLRKFSDL